ncbi:hypothetical protein HNW77_14145 [Komagataeibacter sp. AV436]|uniref:Lipoprotein n=1 Tax=Komagataeibacter melomenusus TaxID=2766578 RepID=A0ABX2AII3_9PROT|nr:hypothetical protein [Komagataeibacter melomenusus]MBV1829629.1 hypothetical protein [Komagataeibacter melomenusus]NPC67502.1 hypothetical protein [Komagataeibacter melomenusus]
MRAAAMLACFMMLAGCTTHHVPLDDDGLPVTNGREMDTPAEGGPQGDRGGGRGGLWSDMLHTAMQAGMGMLHR